MQIIWPDNLSPQVFLDEYWQKKPLLIKDAIPDLPDIVSADELAGLACEAEMESRLIIEDPETHHWHLEHGPIAPERFAQLPENHWTLLVQDIDKHIDAAKQLVALFDFLPKWRIDDLMISYAADQGSVGPHTDSYDVFLIQLMGKRKWQISDRIYQPDDLKPDCDLKVLQNFSATEEWIVGPGDMIYLPPNIAHYGVAQGDCLTGSVGFISPRQNEIFNNWADHINEKLTHQTAYKDPALSIETQPGLLRPEAIKQYSQLLKAMIDTSPGTMLSCFGQMVSKSKQHLEILSLDQSEQFTTESFIDIFSQQPLHKHPFLRLFYAMHDDSKVMLFFDGEQTELPIELEPMIEWMISHDEFYYEDYRQWLSNKTVLNLLTDMTNSGFLYFES